MPEVCHYCGMSDGQPVRHYRDPDTRRNVPAHLTCWLRRLAGESIVNKSPVRVVENYTTGERRSLRYWEWGDPDVEFFVGYGSELLNWREGEEPPF
jgi:hypothetical protein